MILPKGITFLKGEKLTAFDGDVFTPSDSPESLKTLLLMYSGMTVTKKIQTNFRHSPHSRTVTTSFLALTHDKTECFFRATFKKDKEEDDWIFNLYLQPSSRNSHGRFQKRYDFPFEIYGVCMTKKKLREVFVYLKSLCPNL